MNEHEKSCYEWMPMREYMHRLESDLVYQGFMKIVGRVLGSLHTGTARQRRIVYVTRQKHLARKRRKR